MILLPRVYDLQCLGHCQSLDWVHGAKNCSDVEDLDIELAGTVTTRSSMGRVGGSRPMFFSHYCGMRIGRFWPHARSDPISREAVSSVWMSRAGVRSTFTILVSKGRQVIPNVGRFLNGSCEVVRCKLVRS